MMPTTTLSREQAMAAIEKVWSDRATTQGYSKAQRIDRQSDFYSGAMQALLLAGVFDEVPVRWVINVMRGVEILPGDES